MRGAVRMRFDFKPFGCWRNIMLAGAVLCVVLPAGLIFGGLAQGQAVSLWPDVLLGVGLPAVAALLMASLYVTLADTFAEVDGERLRVKMGYLIDLEIPMTDIAAVETHNHSPLRGVGVRTNLFDTVAVVSAAGEVVLLHLKEPHPVRFWPFITVKKTKRLLLSPQHMDEFMDLIRSCIGRVGEGDGP